MHYYITLTSKCNLKCTYCYDKSCEDFDSDFGDYEIDYSLPSEITYNISQLKDFLEKDSATLIFYGGEPLLRREKIREIMDGVRAERFMIQTNGTLLDRLEPDYVNRFHTILVSVDGDEEITDHNRGKGTYRKVIENLRLLRMRGFHGEIIARMTVTEDSEIEKQVKWLLFNEEYSFTSVHWQLDALFWQNDFEKRNFAGWAKRSYNPQIKRLIQFWLSYMEEYGTVLRLYPFVGIMESLLRKEPSKLRCGAGWTVFNIQTDGNISPCPVMAGMKDFYLGNITTKSPDRLRRVFVSEPCTECALYGICGGRCLYANATKLWGKHGFKLVCQTVENLIYSLKAVFPKVRELIAKGRVCYKDFNYPKYNSCEIIP